MKVLLSWLREFAPFEGEPVALGEAMSDLGMAVESLDVIGGGLGGIVVARVLDLRPHPDADKIQLVDVDRGDGEALQICCGAFNMAVGDLVPLATLGTVMPGGMKIERRKLRGQWSNGMLCSMRELEQGDDHAGIWILPSDLEVGAEVRRALGIEPDVLYDLEINPNRPDAMSVAGVARDLAARLRLPFAVPEPVVAEVAPPLGGLARVELVDPDLCGRFLVRVLRDVRVGTSPAWLARRLTLAGMRPINSVVDVSNYVMLELGQPNHTYDLDKVPGGHLRVRWARDGERIVTLDDVERVLGSGDGVIADGDDAAIGIAGVMGGASTEISDDTTAVLLEMAWWQPMAIARTSRRLGLRSEASMRFERGADPEVADLAARRFAQLLADSGAMLAPGVVDERGELPDRAPVRIRTHRVNAYLGTDLDVGTIGGLLTPIGFDVAPAGATGDPVSGDLDVVVPSFRPDTVTETDVIEEIARHFGYGRIGKTVPTSARAGALTDRQRERRVLRQVLLGLGLDEAMPLPLLAPEDLVRAAAPEDPVRLTNPLTAEESVLRTSLRPGLLKALAHNASHRRVGVRLFEIGKVFLAPPEGQQLPDEREYLAAIAGGADAREAVEAWTTVASALGVRDWSLVASEPEGLHPTRSARILVGGVEVGVVGEIDPAVLDAFAVPERAAWLELDLDRLLTAPHGDRRYRRISRYPSSDLDLAFELADSTPAAALRAAIVEAAGELLVGLRLFDVYRGAPLPDGVRSLAFGLRLQAADRTLTDDDVAELRQRVVRDVESALPARLRG
ncbi:MAG: phenylalanine--tRNA ligase subunit beta [Acidimicrobiales bacterium]|jgi:phenylalanyl-tRNA synthetase beta chain|nr:phenylalanine--tRNA ligase subunit beta [Acidimicrobiales bacterium]